MNFHNALKKTLESFTVKRRDGGMTLYMKRDEEGFIRTGVYSPKKTTIIWFANGARIHDDDINATNWEVAKPNKKEERDGNKTR